MRAKLMGLLKDEEGQGMVEYGLILAVIAIVVIVAMGAMSTELSTMFTTITSKF